MTKCLTTFSCRDDSKYGYNTLGPLCLWQCFVHISICSMILWRKLAVFATLSSPGFRFNCFSDGNGWPPIGGCHADDYSMPSTAPVNAEIHHYCPNYHRICQNIGQIHQLWDRSHSAGRNWADSEYWEWDRSWIKSWIGKYCKNSRSSLDVRSDLIDLLRVVLGSVPRGYLQYLPPTFAKFNSAK